MLARNAHADHGAVFSGTYSRLDRAQTGLATVLDDLQRELADEPAAFEAFREALLGAPSDAPVEVEADQDIEELARQFLDQ